MTRICCYTSFNYSYLGRALTLLATVRAAHPDWEVCAVVVDEPPRGERQAELLAGFDLVLGLHDLGIARARAWLFKHDAIEACTAVKGAAMLCLMEAGYDAVVYLDPDIAVFHPLDPIVATLGQAAIVLTPHQCSPNRNYRVMLDNELASMRFGVFNLGCIAVRSHGAGRSFAEWWAAQLGRACYDDVAAGLFTDQKYVDLVPGLFDGVAIVRDPGCNVASWNLSTRRVGIGVDGSIRVNGAPLRFMHFTKIDSVGDIMIERYAGDSIEVLELWSWYRCQIARWQPRAVPPGYWRYGSFSNGVMIRQKVRLLYRESRDLRAAFDDPYDAGGPFYAWLSQAHPKLLGLPFCSAALAPDYATPSSPTPSSATVAGSSTQGCDTTLTQTATGAP